VNALTRSRTENHYYYVAYVTCKSQRDQARHLRTVIHTEAMHGIMNIFSANLLTLQTYLRQSTARATKRPHLTLSSPSYSYSYSDGSPSQPIVSSQKTNNRWPGARRVEYGHSNSPEKRNMFGSYGRIKLTAPFGSQFNTQRSRSPSLRAWV
jgi:hypothetical protein